MTKRLTLAFLLVASTGCLSQNELGHIQAQEFGDLAHGEPDRVAFDARITEACGSGALNELGAGTFRRSPYLQALTSESAELLFMADEEVELDVFQSDDLEDPDVLTPVGASPGSAGGLVAGLGTFNPGSIYCYGLRAAEEMLGDVSGFYTAPDPGERVTFSVFGDLGTATSDQFAVRDQLMKVQSDFVLVTGDVAYASGTRDELQRFFFDVYADILGKVPFFPALGNHDAKTEGGAPFLEAFSFIGEQPGRYHYSFDWGDVHVALIDTVNPSEAQAQWLEQDLASSDAGWKVVVGHHPPYSSGNHGSDGEIEDLFVPVFVRQGVDIVFVGHEHNYERTKSLEGVTYVVTGGGGVGTRPVGESDFTAHSNRVAHFVHLEATDEALTMWAIDGTGQVFDTWQKR